MKYEEIIIALCKYAFQDVNGFIDFSNWELDDTDLRNMINLNTNIIENRRLKSNLEVEQ